MAKLILTKMDLQALCLWARHERERAEEVRVPFEREELDLARKIHEARDRAYHYPSDVSDEWRADWAKAPIPLSERLIPLLVRGEREG